LQHHALVLQQEYFKLKPKLERQHEMMRSLNAIMEAMNSFSVNHAQKWMLFIQREHEITSAFLKMDESYTTMYLNYRHDTRTMVRRSVNDSRQQISEYLNQAFRDLGMKHDDIVQDITQQQERCAEEVAQARAVIDIHHTAIGDKLLEASAVIAQIVKQVDDTLEAKRQTHYHFYITDMQGLCISFVDSIGKMLESFFNDAALDKYLALLDQVCVKDNSEGIAPRSRLSAPANGVPHFDHLSNGCLAQMTWSTIKEYPRAINPIRMMTDAPSLSAAIEKSIRSNVFHGEPEQVQKDAIRMVDSIHQHNSSKMHL